ncbi:MAG: class I SAM-dependent methyltransferase, partial [Ruminiclostridium sp.]
MQRFFEAVLEPIFRLENIRTIVEIGSDKGLNTVKLIRYANDVKGKVYSVDPSPRFDSEIWAEENPESFVMLRDLSLNVIRNIKDADCFLIDGDHNWYTVYNELKMIYDTYGCDKFPLVFFHDIDWPYDRRDLYYSPENIPAVYRNEYEKKGLNPNSCLTSDNGINEQHFNAKRYGGEKNGVLTAVEDFIKDYPELDLRFMSHDVLFGLGMIASPKKYPEAIEYFYSSEALKKMMRIAEKERIDKQIKINALSRTLKEKKASEINPCIAKIYPDFGNGFNEESSVLTGDYNKESGEYYGKVVFEKPPALLRFDPVSDCFCIVDGLSVTGKGGNIEIMDLNGLS